VMKNNRHLNLLIEVKAIIYCRSMLIGNGYGFFTTAFILLTYPAILQSR